MGDKVGHTNRMVDRMDAIDALALTLHRTKALFLALPHVKQMEEAVSLAGLGEELCDQIEKHADALYRSSSPKQSNGSSKLNSQQKQPMKPQVVQPTKPPLTPGE